MTENNGIMIALFECKTSHNRLLDPAKTPGQTSCREISTRFSS